MLSAKKSKILLTGIIAVAIVAAGIFLILSFMQKSKPDEPVHIDIDLSIVAYTPEDLSAKAVAIVRGTVASVSGVRWNTADGKTPEKIDDGYMLYKDNVITVSKTYKGSVRAGDQIIVRTYGGKYSDGKTTVVMDTGDMYGKFSDNEEVIVFLWEDVEYNRGQTEDYLNLAGLLQGKFLIREGIATNQFDTMKVEELESIINKHKDDVLPTPDYSGDPNILQ